MLIDYVKNTIPKESQTMKNELEQYVSELFVLFESVRANIATLTMLTYN